MDITAIWHHLYHVNALGDPSNCAITPNRASYASSRSEEKQSVVASLRTIILEDERMWALYIIHTVLSRPFGRSKD